MGAFDDLIPGGAKGGTFDDLIPQTGGGVQDYEPMQREPRSFGARALDWAKTRGIKAATGFAGQERGLADLMKMAAEKLGVPEHVARGMLMSNPVTAVGQFLPSTEQMNDAVFNKGGVSETNLPGKFGKAADVGVETALQVPAMPGSIVRNVLPAFVGGASQELVGQATEGTPYELPARVLTGLATGGATAVAQNAAGNAAKGAWNVLASNGRNVDEQAARILGRALERDKTNYNALVQGHADFAPGTPLVIAGGENVRGAVRGSTAAPGPARTTVADATENYLVGSDRRATNAISGNVSNEPPIMTRINTLTEERARAARPAYQAAGIPDRIQMTETMVPGEPITKSVPILPGAKAKTTVTEPGEPVTKRSFNTPTIESPALTTLLKESSDMQAAIAAARRLPEFKYLPENSMAMLDKAYKHINGMEQEAVRAGNGTRAHDLRHLRTDLKKALVEANPKYADALAQYEAPSKLIDAATAGREAFAKNMPADEVKRVFAGMPPDQQKEFLGGVADFLRTKAGNSDRATAAERIWNNQNVRDRLKAILPDEQYQAFAKSMEQDKQGAKVLRGINQGSRTTPMAMEAADNAETGNALVNLLRGRVGTAVMDVGNAFTGRLMEGRTQKVNDRLAQWLMQSDPQAINALAAQIEKARLAAIANASNRRNALATGAAAPAIAGAR